MKRNLEVNLRNYDENPIIINDYGALFLAGWYIILFSILVFGFAFSDYGLLHRIYLIALPAYLVLSFLHDTYIFAPRVFKQKPSFFRFSSEQIYHIEYVYENKVESEEKIVFVKDVEKVYFCVISELDSRYGRFHFFTPYQLYKKSSIGVHFNKTKDFIRYLLVYLIFALPFKIYKLKKSGEPLWLLRKNFVIRMKNRNYFLVNCYSRDDYFELLRYFQANKILVEDKTKFMPQAQRSAIFFEDKHEIWSDDPNDTEIPKDDWRRKMRRFFSLE